MSVDLNFNGTAFSGRTGSDRFGTFYTTLEPPGFSGFAGGALHQTWGSRITEHSGRARGLSAVGTLSRNGTLLVTFPASYFSFIPIVRCSELFYGKIHSYVDEIGKMNNEYYVTPFENALSLRTRNILGSQYILSAGILTRNITALGFTLIHKPDIYYGVANPVEPQLKPKYVYWHARGC